MCRESLAVCLVCSENASSESSRRPLQIMVIAAKLTAEKATPNVEMFEMLDWFKKNSNTFRKIPSVLFPNESSSARLRYEA